MKGSFASRTTIRMKWFSLFVFVVIFDVLIMGQMLHKAFAVGGDFKSTDFVAAAPYTYDHSTGGGAYDDRTIGVYADVVEQLEGAQFTCGDTVTFLAAIELKAAPVDPVQTAQFDFRFLADSTGQSGAAIAEVLRVRINYGPVQGGDGPGGSDAFISDDGGSTATLISQSLSGPLFTAGSELLGTVEIDDLEAGERLVLRIDVLLRCKPNSNPTGNLQGQLNAGRVTKPVAGAISTGQQTIPFLRVGDLAGAGEPLLIVSKTVTTANGSCPGSEELKVTTGSTVKYCYVVSNPGTADLYDVSLKDDNGTPGVTSDDLTITLNGLSNLGGVPNLADLATGATATGEKSVTLSKTGTIVNTALATGNNGLSGGNFVQLTDQDIATVIVEAVPNSPPVAKDDSATTSEDTPVIINVASNDTDPDKNLDPASTSITSGPSHGTLVNNGDGTFTYKPNLNFYGTDSFVYTICDTGVDRNARTDSDDLCTTATVTITINPVNDSPMAMDDSYNTSEDTPITIPAPGVLSNDFDPDGDSLTVDSYNQPVNGKVTQNPDGSFTYTPNANFCGTDSFTYTVSDGKGGTNTATVNMNVACVNDPPVAGDNSYSVAEDTTLNIYAPGVLGNDSDPDGEALTLKVLTNPSNGKLTQNADGSFTYTPNREFNGTDSYTYEICDAKGLCDTATVTITVTPVNDPPVAGDDPVTTKEDTPVIIKVLGNDIDPDGDPLTTSPVEGPTNGTLVQNADGTFTYTPNENFNGTDSFTYEACDPSGSCDTATVNITVSPVNDPPVAADDTYSTAEDTPLTVIAPGILHDDYDPDGDALKLKVLTSPGNGTLAQNADGSFTYTPNTNFHGEDTYTYQVCDPAGLCSNPATVTISVISVNDPPIADNDTATVNEDSSVTINVLGNDSDPDGDTLTMSLKDEPNHGTLVKNPDGTFTYKPNENFNGTDSFTYSVCDSGGLCNDATVTITVNPVNDPPVAGDDAYSTDEDVQLTIDAPGVLGNDSDPDGDTLTVSSYDKTSTSGGSVSMNPDGSFSYTPPANFNGTDSFTYQACDPDGLCAKATVNITVRSVQDSPDAVDDMAKVDEDGSITIRVLDNDTDPDGDPIKITEVSEPANGTVTIIDGTITYKPNANFCGADTFFYTVCDNSEPQLCDTANVTVEVACVNDPPVAEDNTYTTAEDNKLIIDAPGILQDDYDLDGDPLTLKVLTNPDHGTLVQNADGSFTYTPDENYYGPDSFTYEVCDPSGSCDSATVSITIVPVNDPPVAGDDTATVNEDNPVTIDVLDNDNDPDGDNLTVSLNEDPTYGTLVQNADGSFTYTPNENFYGTDSFSYKVCDPDGLCSSAKVIITVNPVNDPPVAEDDSYTASEDLPLSVAAPGILHDDYDPDGDVLKLTLLSKPANGTLAEGDNGSFIYIPNENFNGEDTFTYKVCDPSGLCSDPATVTIKVIPVNDPPVATDDRYSTNEDTPLIIKAPGVLGNDSDVDGDKLSITGYNTNTTNGGTVTMDPDGSFTYTPKENFCGTDKFTYSISDGNGGYDTATVVIEVACVNDAPKALDDTYTTNEDTSIKVPAPGILGNDSDPDGDKLTVSVVSGPSQGTLVQNADGSFTYTPNGNFNGVDSYTYKVCDPKGLCAQATVTIIVNPVNDPPVAVNDAYDIGQNTTLTVAVAGGMSVIANDSDVDGDTLTVKSYDATSVHGGTVVMNPDGSFSYTPGAQFAGVDTFNYTVCDRGGLCSTATVTVVVQARNQRSISIESVSFNLVGTNLTGSFYITNQSGGPYDVQIVSMDIGVQYRSLEAGKNQWVPVNTTGCTFNPKPGVVFSKSLTVNFNCTLAAAVPQGATVRVTAKVMIFGRDKEYLSRESK